MAYRGLGPRLGEGRSVMTLCRLVCRCYSTFMRVKRCDFGLLRDSCPRTGRFVVPRRLCSGVCGFSGKEGRDYMGLGVLSGQVGVLYFKRFQASRRQSLVLGLEGRGSVRGMGFVIPNFFHRHLVYGEPLRVLSQV